MVDVWRDVLEADCVRLGYSWEVARLNAVGLLQVVVYRDQVRPVVVLRLRGSEGELLRALPVVLARLAPASALLSHVGFEGLPVGFPSMPVDWLAGYALVA